MALIFARPALLGGTPVCPDGPPPWPPADPDVDAALQAALSDGSWGRYHGRHCEAFSALLATEHACTHALLCASGTAAVELALRGAGVQAGDEVVHAAYDFEANFKNVLLLGATPVLVDVHPDNWNMDASQVEAALTPKTKAILVSHLHGGVSDLPRLRQLADSRGIVLIEDACQMPGATLFGRRSGTWGDVSVLSFGGSKLVTSGRGGAVLTNRDDIAQRIRLYTQRGNESYPLSELQAAVLLPQWLKLADRNAKRAHNVSHLTAALTLFPGLRPFTNAGNVSPAYYKLGLQYDPAFFGDTPRERFVEAVRAEGIAIDTGFRALHRTHSARRYRAVGPLAVATQADARVLTLHHPVLLGTSEDVRQVMEAVSRCLRAADELNGRPGTIPFTVPKELW